MLWLRGRRLRAQFAAEMLVIHLATHASTPDERRESTMLHLEQELGWAPAIAKRNVGFAEQRGWVNYQDGLLQLTGEGRARAELVSER
jgi:hypothetical protein